MEIGVEERAFQVEGTAWEKAWGWEGEEHVQCSGDIAVNKMD